jgi:hypothetical protein
MFSAQASYIYTITTSSWGQRTDTFLTLFDTDGTTVLLANDDYADTTDFSSRIVWQAPANGVYYVRITNRTQLSGCDTEYEVWLEAKEMYRLFLPVVTNGFGPSAATGTRALFAPTGIINHICPDPYETDDTWQTAQPITADLWQSHSFDSDPRGFAADKDFVWFSAKAGRTVTFTLAPINNTQPLMELYDKEGVALDISDSSQLVWTPNVDGRFYLGVRPLTTIFGCVDAVGYGLLLTEEPLYELYLPVLYRPTSNSSN